MSLPTLPDPFIERPLQRRSVESQVRDLDIDPMQESPLEQSLGVAILGLLLDPAEFGPPAFINLFMPRGSVSSLEEFPPILSVANGIINVTPGCWFNSYQADFLFCVKAPLDHPPAWGALECDGHNFHERTPGQVAHDRARDREMQALGIAVLRFPGWQVHDDPAGCAREAINILIRISRSKAASKT